MVGEGDGAGVGGTVGGEVGKAKVAVGENSVGEGSGGAVSIGEEQAVASRKASPAICLPLTGEKPDFEIIKRDLKTFGRLRACVERERSDVVRGIGG